MLHPPYEDKVLLKKSLKHFVFKAKRKRRRKAVSLLCHYVILVLRHDLFDHNANDENDNEEQKGIIKSCHSIYKIIALIMNIFLKLIHGLFLLTEVSFLNI